jgi:hypothetical protein
LTAIRICLLLALILFTLYEPAELTRVIVTSGHYYYPEKHGSFVREISFIWSRYGCFIFLSWVILFKREWLDKTADKIYAVYLKVKGYPSNNL